PSLRRVSSIAAATPVSASVAATIAAGDSHAASVSGPTRAMSFRHAASSPVVAVDSTRNSSSEAPIASMLSPLPDRNARAGQAAPRVPHRLSSLLHSSSLAVLLGRQVPPDSCIRPRHPPRNHAAWPPGARAVRGTCVAPARGRAERVDRRVASARHSTTTPTDIGEHHETRSQVAEQGTAYFWGDPPYPRCIPARRRGRRYLQQWLHQGLPQLRTVDLPFLPAMIR